MSGVMITVVIVTFGRPIALRRCLTAVDTAASTVSPRPQIIVVTQQDGLDYSQLQSEFPRVRWVTSPGPGLGKCRNFGAGLAEGKFLTFLDDDCTVAQDFFVTLESILLTEEPTALCGRILAAGSNIPFVPEMTAPPCRVTLRNYCLFMGSCHVVRAEVFRMLTGYDPRFGAGATFPAAEETELLLRLLEAGHQVAFRPQMQVYHPVDGQDTAGRNRLRWTGMGALYAKHIRAGMALGADFPLFVVKPTCSALLRVLRILPRKGREGRLYRELLQGVFGGIVQYQREARQQ